MNREKAINFLKSCIPQHSFMAERMTTKEELIAEGLRQKLAIVLGKTASGFILSLLNWDKVSLILIRVSKCSTLGRQYGRFPWE